MSDFRLEVTESSIDKWLREFQRKHDELRHIGLDELQEIAYALHDDIPMGYEASMRLADWLLHVELMSNGGTCHNLKDSWPSLFECDECGYSNYDTYYGSEWHFKFCPNCGRKVVD